MRESVFQAEDSCPYVCVRSPVNDRERQGTEVIIIEPACLDTIQRSQKLSNKLSVAVLGSR